MMEIAADLVRAHNVDIDGRPGSCRHDIASVLTEKRSVRLVWYPSGPYSYLETRPRFVLLV